MEEPEIRPTQSTVVYENPWMKVREDKIVRRSGGAGIYGVVEKDDFAVIAALQDGRLHLVEQYRYPVGGRYWEFPQGSSKTYRDDPLATAKAELREETGMVANSIVHVGRLFEAYGYASQALDAYFATDLHLLGVELEAEEEGLVTRTCTVAEVERMIVEGVIRDAATVATFGLLRLKGLL